MAAVNAFKQAFPNTEKSVGLVLKTMNTNPSNTEWQSFLKECKADKRIYVLNQTIDRPELLGLIDCCDAYVSFHRAEGFGRTIAEAIMFNKPVITLNYSGNSDFKHYKKNYFVEYDLVSILNGEYSYVSNHDEAVWANIKINSAVKMMKLSREESEIFSHDVAHNNKYYIKFKPTQIGKEMLSILKSI
jgi:glycosyltransferase involved in cell wall biosynthesis